MNIKHVAGAVLFSAMLLSSYAIAQVPAGDAATLTAQTNAAQGAGAAGATGAAAGAGLSPTALAIGGGIVATALAGGVLAATLGGNSGGSGAPAATATLTSQ